MMFGLLWIHQNPFYSLLRGKNKKKDLSKYYRKLLATWGCKLFILLTVLLALNAGTVCIPQKSLLMPSLHACEWCSSSPWGLTFTQPVCLNH